MSIRVISYYTVNTPYEQEIRKLETSCKQFQIPYDFLPMQSTGAWITNCGLKPVAISNLLCKYANDPTNLLWVDADGVILEPLTLDLPYDLAFYRLKGELLSGTLFMRNTPNLRKFIDHWCEIQKIHPSTFDQVNLDRALKGYKDLNVGPLPEQYATIFDTMYWVRKPVIKHFQASRRFKSVVSRSS